MRRTIMGALILALGVVWFNAQLAQAQRVRTGVLNCDVSAGLGLIIGSQRSVNCLFTPDQPGPQEGYFGTITKLGLDIGATAGGVMVWAVFAPTSGPPPGSLDGTYGGVTASATAGVGVGANLLICGSDRSISLQPLSVEGNTGLNVAGGIAGLRLHYLP